jgi:hypothetical protein
MTMFNHTTAPVRSSGWLPGMRATLNERRHARAARRALEADLASYRSPAEIDDLLAALERADDSPVTEQIRTILYSNLTHRTAA